MDRRRLRGLLAVFALGGALASGCKTSSTGWAPTASPIGDDPTVDLSANQVADMQLALAKTLEQRGDVDKARQCYATAIRNDPTRVDAYVRLGSLHARRGEFKEANDLYHRALEIDPKNSDVYCNLGYANYLQERWTEAEAALRKCLELRPDHKRAHNNLGLVLARRHQPDAALAAFRKAGCSEADARLNLGYVHTLQGDLGDARRQYNMVLVLDPSSEAAKHGLNRADVLATKLKGSAGLAAVTDSGPIEVVGYSRSMPYVHRQPVQQPTLP